MNMFREGLDLGDKKSGPKSQSRCSLRDGEGALKWHSIWMESTLSCLLHGRPVVGAVGGRDEEAAPAGR
jgi:hypothetical protein